MKLHYNFTQDYNQLRRQQQRQRAIHIKAQRELKSIHGSTIEMPPDWGSPRLLQGVASDRPETKNSLRRVGQGVLERERRRKARRRVENRRIILEIKRVHGCFICGRRDLPPHKLAFHHISGRKKVRKVSHMVSSSTPALIREVKECRLVCVSAHQAFHAGGKFPCGQESVLSENEGVSL